MKTATSKEQARVQTHRDPAGPAGRDRLLLQEGGGWTQVEDIRVDTEGGGGTDEGGGDDGPSRCSLVRPDETW